MAERKLIVGGIYRHFKGNEYRVNMVAEGTEDGKQYVVYSDAYSTTAQKFWVRPYDEFMSVVDRDKYPEATQENRFMLIRVPENCEHCNNHTVKELKPGDLHHYCLVFDHPVRPTGKCPNWNPKAGLIEEEEDEVCEACAITYSWERGEANVLGETNDADD